MYYIKPPECSGEEFRIRINEGRESAVVAVPSVIHSIVKGLALEYLVELELEQKEQTLMMYLINTGSLTNNETIDALSEKTKLSRPSVIGAFSALVQKGMVIRKRKGGDKTDISPFIGKMLRFKRLYDVYPHELKQLMGYFGNGYEDPILALQVLISKLFSITPEPPLTRFLRVCLLSGFDERSLKDETVKAIREIVSSKELDEEKLLQTAISGEKSWEKTITFYQEKSIKTNKKFSELIHNVINEIERMLKSPQQMIDELVGKDELFYNNLAQVFPNMEYENMRPSELMEEVANTIEQTEDKVNALLRRFVS